MKCPNCGAEVREEDKFCGECGKPLRRRKIKISLPLPRKIEIAPIWKWGSMIASLVLIFIFWLILFMASGIDPEYPSYRAYFEGLLALLIFGFPATVYLMYKERIEKIKYGLGWILFPILMLWKRLSSGYAYEFMDLACSSFLWLVIPAVVIDVIYVYKTR